MTTIRDIPSEPDATDRTGPPSRKIPTWVGVLTAAAAVIVAGALVAVGAAASADDDATPRRPASNAQPVSHDVLYEVEGTTDYASVTLTTPTGTRQINPDVPMTRTSGQRGLEFTARPGTTLGIVAQNNRGYGTISCRITVNGQTLSENESHGGYAVVTCSGVAR